MVLRKKHNLNYNNMAKILNISKDTYGRKERGESQFTLDEMFLLSKYFDLPLDEIFLPRDCINNAIN